MGLYAFIAFSAGIRLGGIPGPMTRPKGLIGYIGQFFATAILCYGAALTVGLVLGSTNPLDPFEKLGKAAPKKHLEFERIKSVDDFEAARIRAAEAGVPLMLDFYADWCVSCKEMEHYTFTDTRVQDALKGAVLVQADVTANDAIDQALLSHFGIFGPPTIVFFDRDGNEIKGQRVIGYMPADDYLTHLDYVLR
jgi:thiol:disulfide interchange protein DsbD